MLTKTNTAEKLPLIAIAEITGKDTVFFRQAILEGRLKASKPPHTSLWYTSLNAVFKFINKSQKRASILESLDEDFVTAYREQLELPDSEDE